MIEMNTSVLTCAHDTCGCQVQVVAPCGCAPEGDAQYKCHCGAPLVPVS